MSDEEKKYPPGRHPNTLANLKPIQPGQVLNPAGAGAQDPVTRELKKFTSQYLSEMIELAVLGDLSELKKVAEDPKTPAIQVGIAKVLHKGISEGNWNVIEQLLARTIGKVPDKFDHTSGGKPIEGGIAVSFVKAEPNKNG